jgi:hypothetical protein
MTLPVCPLCQSDTGTVLWPNDFYRAALDT